MHMCPEGLDSVKQLNKYITKLPGHKVTVLTVLSLDDGMVDNFCVCVLFYISTNLLL